jgi:hypothetical protein
MILPFAYSELPSAGWVSAVVQVRGYWRPEYFRNGRVVRGGWVSAYSRSSPWRLAVPRSARTRWTSSRDRNARRRQSAANAATRIGTARWQARVVARAQQAVGTDLWAERHLFCTAADCQALSRAARDVLQTRNDLHTLAGNAAAEAWASMRPNTFEGKLASRIVQHFPQLSDPYFEKAARCLQALGILCCLSAGRDMLQCRCLQDLSQGEAIKAVESHLRDLAKEEAWPTLRNDLA